MSKENKRILIISPMLDVDLVELTMRLPDRHLIRNRVGKNVLRKAFKNFCPVPFFSHPKTGFSIPPHRFQNTAYIEMAHHLLENNRQLRGLFHERPLFLTLKKGLSRHRDQADLSVYRASHQVWGLMQLSAWIERFRVSV